jgi:hypothetical protein
VAETDTLPAGDEAGRYVRDQLEYGRRCYEAALDYAKRGWLVLPICHYQHHGCGKDHARRCRTPGRTPLVPAAPYADHRPGPVTLAGWWREWPVAGVGLVLGAAGGMIAVEVEGEAGEKKLLEVSGGRLPPTCVFATDRGRVLLYRVAPGGFSHTVAHEVEGGALRLLGDGMTLPLPPSGIPDGGGKEDLRGN